MDQFYLPLFIFNTIMIIVDASVGYHLAPQLLSSMDDTEALESGVSTTRKFLSAVVALYMFFNCVGYFQMRSTYLFAVSGLILLDLSLQYFLHRKRRSTDKHLDDHKE
jgi:uncharacterized protein YacL